MTKKMQRPITLVLALTMLISVFASYAVVESAAETDTTKYPQYTTEYGSVMIDRIGKRSLGQKACQNYRGQHCAARSRCARHAWF